MEATLDAEARDTFGKNEARRTRAAGKVPAVLYGEGKDAKAIAVEPKALLKILHSDSGANTLIALKVGGKASGRVLVKDYQLDPITHHLLHADFYSVAMDKLLRVAVPVTVKGEAPGVKQQAGVLEFIRRELEVECLPADIPEHIEVDISNLMLHQGIRVREIPANPKIKFVSDGDAMLLHVIMPKEEVVAPAAEATAAAATATPAEPEVIKKGKKDEEAPAAEAAAPAAKKEEKKK